MPTRISSIRLNTASSIKVFRAVFTLEHRKALENDYGILGRLKGQITDDRVHLGSTDGALHGVVFLVLKSASHSSRLGR